jgi:hypothetical protein
MIGGIIAAPGRSFPVMPLEQNRVQADYRGNNTPKETKDAGESRR